jgi:hypothetical protein
MHKKKLTWTGNIGLGLLFAATTVLAQPAPEDTAGGKAPESEVSFRKGSQLTPQEQLAQAEMYISKMKGTLDHMGKMAEQARKEKDLIKLNCVNDKVIQVKGHLNLAEQSRDALKVASARNDEGTRNHEFAKLTITYQKVIVLAQEAEACIGEEISYVGATRVMIEVDKDIPSEDPTVTAQPAIPIVRPPLASPFR